MKKNGDARPGVVFLSAASAVLIWCSSCGSADPIERNEAAAIKALKDFVQAQNAYKEKRGRYTEILSDLDMPLEKEGYQFTLVPNNGDGDMDYRNDFVLCAVPAVYGTSGIHTFGMGPKGIVIMKDNKGRAVQNAVEFADGTWRQR